MSTAALFEGAAAEIADDDPEWHYGHLLALHGRPTQEVFDTARALARDSDPLRRRLGVRVLREVGYSDPAAAELRRGNAPPHCQLARGGAVRRDFHCRCWDPRASPR